jgi:hypothetical protein
MPRLSFSYKGKIDGHRKAAWRREAMPSAQAPSRSAKACTLATAKCVTCHMPKVNIAVMHSDFTDHRIRIVRKCEPYPE